MIKRVIKEYSILTFGAVLAATAIYLFMLPCNLAIGSSAALAMVLSNIIPLPVSVMSLIINVFLLICGFVLIGPEFGAKTVYTSIVMPVSLSVWELIYPNNPSLTQDPLLDMICYITVLGVAMALLFSHNASSGGLDIVAKIMNKYLKMQIGTAVSIAGIVVALTSVFYYDSKTVIISVIGTYASGIIVDRFIFGLNIKRRVCVLSEHIDQIIDYILYDLHSGATLYESIGAYDHTSRKEVVAIVYKNEYRKLMDYVRQVDPKAFVTVYSVNEVCYQPKMKKNRE